MKAILLGDAGVFVTKSGKRIPARVTSCRADSGSAFTVDLETETGDRLEFIPVDGKGPRFEPESE